MGVRERERGGREGGGEEEREEKREGERGGREGREEGRVERGGTSKLTLNKSSDITLLS